MIEEYLDGPEVSLFVLTDGDAVVPLVPAQDFKRIGDGDSGPNTGGMGAYAPLDWLPPGFTDDIVASVARPTVDEMRRRGTPFAGLLYIGLAVTARGPRVVEFNARFGDPETQVVLALLDTPLAAVLRWAATGGPAPTAAVARGQRGDRRARRGRLPRHAANGRCHHRLRPGRRHPCRHPAPRRRRRGRQRRAGALDDRDRR